MIKKQLYEAPATEVLELRLKGTVLTVSGGFGESFGGFDEENGE